MAAVRRFPDDALSQSQVLQIFTDPCTEGLVIMVTEINLSNGAIKEICLRDGPVASDVARDSHWFATYLNMLLQQLGL